MLINFVSKIFVASKHKKGWQKISKIGSGGCGSVDSAVTSDSGGPGFESSPRQLLLTNYLLLTASRKDEIQEKEAGNGPLK